MLQIAFKVFLIFTFLEPLLWYRDPTLGTGSTPFGPGFPEYASCPKNQTWQLDKLTTLLVPSACCTPGRPIKVNSSPTFEGAFRKYSYSPLFLFCLFFIRGQKVFFLGTPVMVPWLSYINFFLALFQVDEGWWAGEVHGERGMFPQNYVKVIK